MALTVNVKSLVIPLYAFVNMAIQEIRSLVAIVNFYKSKLSQLLVHHHHVDQMLYARKKQTPVRAVA